MTVSNLFEEPTPASFGETKLDEMFNTDDDEDEDGGTFALLVCDDNSRGAEVCDPNGLSGRLLSEEDSDNEVDVKNDDSELSSVS